MKCFNWFKNDRKCGYLDFNNNFYENKKKRDKANYEIKKQAIYQNFNINLQSLINVFEDYYANAHRRPVNIETGIKDFLEYTGENILFTILGAVIGNLNTILNYYFGSSSSSSEKNDIIKTLKDERPTK